MARHKVKLAFILNNTARKATYKKRKQGLLKKMLEITTLCGVEGCVVIYNPYEAQPVAWPSPEEAKHILTKFKALPKMDQFKKMSNQESYVRDRLRKDGKKLDKRQRLNREMEVDHIVSRLLIGEGNWSLFKPIDISDIGYVIEKKQTEFFKRIQFLEKNIREGVGLSGTSNVGQGYTAVEFGFNQTAIVQFGAVNFAGNVVQGNMIVGSGFNQTAMVQFEDMNFASNAGQGNVYVGSGFNQTAMVQSRVVNFAGNSGQGNTTMGFKQTTMVKFREVNFAGNSGQGNPTIGFGFNQTAMVQSEAVNFAGNVGKGNPTMGFGLNQNAMTQTEKVNLAGNVGQQNPMVNQSPMITQSKDEVSFTGLLKMADAFLLDGTDSGSGSTSNNVAGQEVKPLLDLDWANRFK